MADPKQQQQPTGAENKGGGLWDKIRGWLGRGSGPAQEGPTAPRGVTQGAVIAGKHQDNPLLAKDGYTGALALQTGGNFDANSPVAQALQLSDDLMQRYRDAEDMDDYDLTSSIFTLYADDASIPDSNTGRSIWASSKDKLVRDVLEDLLTRRLRLEDDVHGLARTLGKYGNRFGEVLVGKQGVVGINFLAPPTMRRVQDNHGTTLGFIQDPTGQFKLTQREFDAALKVARDQRKPVNGCVVFEPWEIVHWRLRQKDTTAVYGVSVLDGGRWAWKRLMMMEDTALVTKLTRGPSRNAFYIDTGDLPPAEGWAHVKKIQQQYSRKKVFNPTTNQIDFRYNVQCLTGDTRVRLLDGTERSLVAMAEAHERGEEQWVYSVDLARNGKFVPGKVAWAGKTRQNAELIKLTLDNGETVRLTPDHKCIRRSGERVEAQDLKPGDALMPLRVKPAEREWHSRSGKYEHLYDPDTRRYVVTHRVVARECGFKTEGMHIHHDFGRGNNAPWALRALTPGEHIAWHAARGEDGNTAIKRKRADDPIFDQRMREQQQHAARLMVDAGRRPEVRARISKGVSESNRLRDSGQYLRAYNVSEKHKQDNAIRSEAARSYWGDEQNKQRVIKLRTIQYSSLFMAEVALFLGEHPTASADVVAQFVKTTPQLMAEVNGASFQPVTNVCRHSMLRAYRQHGFDSFTAFRQSAIAHNHKVVAVDRIAEREDTYTLTVEGAHTFGLSAGIFVCNSNLEDLWLPTRGGKDSTRVDVLQGVDNQDLDILEYFRNKVLAAAQTPKRLLGMEETTGRIASGDDVRFARAAMRVQREVRNGMKQVCRVHLAALGIDPDAVAFDLHMTVPSYIFELAQLEVRLQQAQLAQGLGELVPQPWILQHVFGFSQDEAIYVTDEARKDKRGAMKGDAATQAEIIREYPETVMGPMGAEGGLPPEMGAAEGAVPEAEEPRGRALEGDAAVKARLDRLLSEHGRVTRLTERMAARVEGIDRTLEAQARQARRDRRAAGHGRRD
jgi:hypothetical protein